MGNQSFVGDRLRQRLRAERERRGWSQSDVVAMLDSRGITLYSTTISKIESGKRPIFIDELCALAEIFGISVDALIGRSSTGSDLAWAISKLTTGAQKVSVEIAGLYGRVNSELEDVRYYATFGAHSAAELIESTEIALNAMKSAQQALEALANRFPLVGLTERRS